MNNLKVRVGYIPERLIQQGSTPKERANQFNKWAKRLLVSETVDK